MGLCVADIANPLFAQFAAYFERSADELGYSTFISNTREDPQVEARYVQTLLARKVDGLVVSPVGSDLRSLRRQADAQSCRLVVFDRPHPGVDGWSVLLNNRQAMRQLAALAIRLGHRRIGVIGGSPSDESLRLRAEGIRDALLAAGLDPQVARGPRPARRRCAGARRRGPCAGCGG